MKNLPGEPAFVKLRAANQTALPQRAQSAQRMKSVIASEAKQSPTLWKRGLLRRFTPRMTFSAISANSAVKMIVIHALNHPP